jgi:putative sterol carrier protein
MANATTAFFEELGRREHEPLLEKATGTLRFDLVDDGQTERWLVDIRKGDVAVTHRSGKADCVVRVEKRIFDSIASGKTNGMAALLRGTISVEGRPSLLVLFTRLFPGPAGASDERRSAGYARRQR